MFWSRLKKYSPRGLYARAALIVLVPVMAVQLVVVVALAQRYFDDITTQLMESVVAQTQLYVEASSEPDAYDIQARLDQSFEFISRYGAEVQPIETKRPWYDFSALVIADVLAENFEGFTGLDTQSSQTRVVFTIRMEEGHLYLNIPRSRTAASNPHQMFVLTIFTGLIMTLVAFIYMRNQIRPIRLLAQAAERFGRGETVPYRLRGALEVRAAGAAFLAMRARIERQIEQRTLMLSGVSHDLRTPLTRVRLGLSMLEESEEIDDMRRDLDEMEGLIETFLSFARADRLEEPREIDLTALLKDHLRKRAGEDVKGTLPPHSVMMMLRPVAIERAVGNLIDNAMRYGSRAEVTLREHGKSVVISVEDDGPGIAPEAREDAQQPFVRLDQSRNQDLGSGVGLGLAITSDIIRRHGGSLRLSSGERLGGLLAEIVLAKES